ncbi:hypothetical protein ACPV5U_08645 [Vibrio mediterranei]
MFQTARQQFPDEYREYASSGFKQAIKLLSYSANCDFDQAFSMVCIRLSRAEEQVFPYLRSGLPDNLVQPMLEILKQHQVPFSVYQLKPTKKLIQMHKDVEKRHKKQR